MFLHQSVILSTGGACMVAKSQCLEMKLSSDKTPFVTTHKRSLKQGYVFTGVCQSMGNILECSGISFESKAGLSVGTSMALAPECALTFPWKCTW